MTQVKRAVILMNLGSPDSTEIKDVKAYLKEFLMDERVIDMSYLARTILIKGIIVPPRAPKSAHAYKTVWTEAGSPLIVITGQLQEALAKEIKEPIEIAMRYGKPTMKKAYDNIMNKYPGVEEVILVPLYPHYAMSSFETAVVHAASEYKKGKYPFSIKFIKPFYDDAAYIHALAESMRPHLKDYDHVLFSYHGIPERHVIKTDVTGHHCLQSPDCCQVPSPAHKKCYRHQCFRTTELVTKELGLPKDKFSIAFQSRLGRSAWLNPDSAVRFTEMPKEGIKRLLVVCPAFVSDCLETLEEIAIRGKESFLESGGERFEYIPCLNVHPLWIKALSSWIGEFEHGKARMALKTVI